MVLEKKGSELVVRQEPLPEMPDDLKKLFEDK